MVFSSIPAYLDPSNWQQQQSHRSGDGSNIAIPHLRQQLPPPLVHPSPPPPRPPPLQQPHHVINNGDIIVASSNNSPRSMSERARLANIPIPEPCLNCPRCESTNTKFCYFNNYNLTQPRHFCKTCRRYWTRGGALRSVPVGGGCRRNKRSKSISNSKSITSGDQHQSTAIPSYNNNSTNNTNTVLDLTRHLPQQLTLLSPLGQRSDHTGGVSMINYAGGFQSGDHTSELNSYQMGVGNGIGSFSLEQWRLNQLQHLGGLHSSIMGNGLYQIQGGGSGSGGGGGQQGLSYVGETSHHNDDHQVIRDNNKPSNSVFTQLDLTDHKMEENQGLTRNLMGNPRNNSWSGATWSDYINTRFSSSCTKDPS